MNFFDAARNLSIPLLIAAFAFRQPAAAQPRSHILTHVSDGETYRLVRNTHPRIGSAADQGAVAASFALPDITLDLQLSATQQQQLTQLLADQQNSATPRYHKWLIPEQYGERFGISSSDYSKIKDWLESKGFHNVQLAHGRNFISMSGDAARVESAFHTVVHRYQAEGRLHFANATDPVLPLALQPVVAHIRGLDDFAPLSAGRAAKFNPHLTSTTNGDHFLAPGDFATIYDLGALYNQGIDGSGQKIAIPGQSDIDLTQVASFRKLAGLDSSNVPQVVLGGSADPGVQKDSQREAYLDVEWAGGVAKNAKIIYVNSTNAIRSLVYAVDNNLASVISMSYGDCEKNAGDGETVLQQANSQGITVVVAAGDAGAAMCDATFTSTPITFATHGLAVLYPASSEYVTAVGGTEFYDDVVNPFSYWASFDNSDGSSVFSYIPEEVWNETSLSLANGGGFFAGGGGASNCFAEDANNNCLSGLPKPSWQTGAGVPADGVRDVPDVSLNAAVYHDAYVICIGSTAVDTTGTIKDCANGYFAGEGGTSAGAPSFAGIVALLNQAYGSAQGNVNPRLYSLAAISTDAFHDITTGDNIVPCQAGTPDCPANPPFQFGYSAGPGYDLASGLGSVDGQHPIEEWAPGFFLSTFNPHSTTIAAGASVTGTAQVTFLGGFTGTVALTCTVSAVLTNTTCSLPTTSVAGTSPISVTLSNSSSARIWPHIVNVNKTPFLLSGLASGLLLLTLAVALTIGQSPQRFRIAVSGFGLMCLLALSSCGGGSSFSSTTPAISTPTPVTGTVTINAISGTVSHSTTISVTQD